MVRRLRRICRDPRPAVFMPEVPALGDGRWLQLVVSPDPSDPKLAHPDGLNLSLTL
jgi:hypothetical protein